MSNLPTPPTPAPEPNRIGNVSPAGDGRSAYWGLDARGTVAAYVKRVHAIEAQSIALVLANLVAMIWFIEGGHFALYLVGFVLLFAIVVIARVRIGTLFLKLGEVVSQDCDPARYRAVLDVLSARDRFGRSANTIAIELAYCDYLELDSAGALRRLESVTFKRKDNIRWFRAMQIEFLSRIDVGDLDGARDALCVSEELQGGLAQPCLRRPAGRRLRRAGAPVRRAGRRRCRAHARAHGPGRLPSTACELAALSRRVRAAARVTRGGGASCERSDTRAAYTSHGAPARRGSVGAGGERVMEYAVFRLAVEYLPHTGYGAIVERG